MIKPNETKNNDNYPFDINLHHEKEIMIVPILPVVDKIMKINEHP